MSIPERRIGLYSQGSSGWTSIRYEELQEDDVWGGFHERNEFPPKVKEPSSSSSSTLKRLPSSTKMIPRSNKNPNHEPKMTQHFAPVNIPDWSKIYGATSQASYNPRFLDGHNQDKEGDGFVRSGWNSDDEEDIDGGGQLVPPHEWLARKLARSQISSFSVCEGVGRTLKGRDLKRVRNAVLTKTGFLE